MQTLIALMPQGIVGHIVFAMVLTVLLHLTRPVYLAFRRQKTGYGVVFNSVTGLPMDLVTVRLIDEHGQTVSSAVSDKHGRYRIAARPGEFTVDVAKQGYTFPSQYLKKHSTVYANILPTARIRVKDYGIITKNIPIDPAAAGRSKVFGVHIALGKNTQYLLAYLSPFVVIAYPLIRGGILPWILYGLYLGALLVRLLTFKPGKPAFGTITDAETERPVSQAVVRIFDAKFNKLKETQVTAGTGRYAFVVSPGAYYVLIHKPGYKRVRLNFPDIKREGFTLTYDVKLKRLPMPVARTNIDTQAPAAPTQNIAYGDMG